MDSIPVIEIQWNWILWSSRAQIKTVRLHLKRSHCKIKCSLLSRYPFSLQFSISMILSSNYLSRIGRTNIFTEPTSIHRKRKMWFTETASVTRKVQTEPLLKTQDPPCWLQHNTRLKMFYIQTGNTVHILNSKKITQRGTYLQMCWLQLH